MQFGYTNPNDTEGIMDLISAGAQILLFVTGRGSVIGSPVAPLIKITGNSRTYAADDRGHGLRRRRGAQRANARSDGRRDELARAGDATWPPASRAKPEALGHREYFVMYKHQDTPALADGCRA